MQTKKLQSIQDSKFKMSDEDTMSIVGGITDYSYEYSWTNVRGESLWDSKVVDICIVFK